MFKNAKSFNRNLDKWNLSEFKPYGNDIFDKSGMKDIPKWNKYLKKREFIN